MQRRRIQLLASLAGVLTFAACTLNPQPLPPSDPEANGATSDDAGFGFGRTTDSAPAPLPNSAFDAALPSQEDADADTDAGADAGADADAGPNGS